MIIVSHKGNYFITSSTFYVIHYSLLALSKIHGFQYKALILFPCDILLDLKTMLPMFGVARNIKVVIGIINFVMSWVSSSWTVKDLQVMSKLGHKIF